MSPNHSRFNRPRLAWILFATLTCACAARRPTPTTPPPVAPAPEPARTVPIVAMHLVATSEARGWMAQMDVDCNAQGQMSWRAAPSVAHIAGNRVLGPNDVELFAVGGEVTYGRARRRRVQIVDGGAVLLNGRERMYFDETGGIVSARPGRPLRWLPLRMNNFNPDSLDQAAMMLVYGITQAQR